MDGETVAWTRTDPASRCWNRFWKGRRLRWGQNAFMRRAAYCLSPSITDRLNFIPKTEKRSYVLFQVTLHKTQVEKYIDEVSFPLHFYFLCSFDAHWDTSTALSQLVLTNNKRSISRKPTYAKLFFFSWRLVFTFPFIAAFFLHFIAIEVVTSRRNRWKRCLIAVLLVRRAIVSIACVWDYVSGM